MKKVILIISIFCLVLTGCGKYSQKNIIKELENKIKNSYSLSGDLEINNNDEVYTYKVKVSYKKDDYYKVSMVNVSNQHKQIILKNDDGVFVLTPSLNKSFKFQSEWPYDNSQIYLLNTIVNDISKDKNRKFIKKDNKYIFETKVNYPNNSKLYKQKIIFNKNLKLEKVIVYDKDGVEKMKMVFNKINYSPNFSKNEFSIDKVINNKSNSNASKTSSMEDVIYPLFLPDGTKLTNEEKIKKDNGERVIMNYDGEKSFLLVEETADVFNEFTIIPSYGEPLLLMDTLGVMTNNSLSWTSGGIDYYLVSDVMNMEEMVEVAQSINGTISIK